MYIWTLFPEAENSQSTKNSPDPSIQSRRCNILINKHHKKSEMKMIKQSQGSSRWFKPSEGHVHIIETFTIRPKYIFLRWCSSYFFSKYLNCNMSPPTKILQNFLPEDGLCYDINISLYSYLVSKHSFFQKDSLLLFKCQK